MDERTNVWCILEDEGIGGCSGGGYTVKWREEERGCLVKVLVLVSVIVVRHEEENRVLCGAWPLMLLGSAHMMRVQHALQDEKI